MSKEIKRFPKILGTASLNDKGQLVVPREARQALQLAPGSKVVVMSSQKRPMLMLMKAEDVESLMRDLDSAFNSN